MTIAFFFLAALFIVIPMAFFVGHIKLWASSHYECPSCHEKFTPKKYRSALFSLNVKGYKRLVCPKCGHKDWMKGVQD